MLAFNEKKKHFEEISKVSYIEYEWQTVSIIVFDMCPEAYNKLLI